MPQAISKRVFDLSVHDYNGRFLGSTFRRTDADCSMEARVPRFFQADQAWVEGKAIRPAQVQNDDGCTGRRWKIAFGR